MPKKYIYEPKEINALFHEQILKENPTIKNPAEKMRFSTTAERMRLFLAYVNGMGDKGWRLISTYPLLPEGVGGERNYLFEKEIYKK